MIRKLAVLFCFVMLISFAVTTMAMAEAPSGGSGGGGSVKPTKSKPAKISGVDKNTEIKVHYLQVYTSYYGDVIVNATLIIPGKEGEEYSIAATPAIGPGRSYYSYYSKYLGGHVIDVHLYSYYGDDQPKMALRIRAINKNGKVSNKAPLLVNPQTQGGGGAVQRPDGDICIWGPWVLLPIFPVVPIPPGVG